MNFKLQSSVYPPLAWKISRASFSVCSSFCSRTASVFSSLYIHRLSLSPSNSPRSTRTAGACCILVRGHVGHAAERPDTVLREAQHGGQRVQCAQEQRQGLVLRGVQCGLAVGRVHELGVAATDRRIDHRILTDHQRTSAIIEVHLAETTPLRPGPACKIVATHREPRQGVLWFASPADRDFRLLRFCGTARRRYSEDSQWSKPENSQPSTPVNSQRIFRR